MGGAAEHNVTEQGTQCNTTQLRCAVLTVKYSVARSNALHGYDMSHAGAPDDLTMALIGALTVLVVYSTVVTHAVYTGRCQISLRPCFHYLDLRPFLLLP